MIESCPIKIAFDAKQKMTGLNVIASLDAGNEFGKAAVEIVAWNVQVATGPCPAEIPADIKSRPIIWRCGSGRGGAFTAMSAARAAMLTPIATSATLPKTRLFIYKLVRDYKSGMLPIRLRTPWIIAPRP
jgi:hypothetical protein